MFDSEFIYTILRTFVSFGFLLFMSHLLGKQTLAQMTNHDFITMIVMGSIAANLAFNTAFGFIHMLTSLALIGFLGYVATRLSLKSRFFRKWFNGEPTVLIENGKILEENLKRQKYSIDTLKQSLREYQVFDLSDVHYAILEPDGHISVQKKPELVSVTKKDLHLLAPPIRYPIELVIEGEIHEVNFDKHKLSREWLTNELRKRGCTLHEVFYCVLGTHGQLFFDLYKDNITSPIDTEE
ncbi:DUF421 domain-containing protein [Halalkalibacterium ligniniphilum]|uniref:DUF421 domain-containing protein n=1 Tax=Halalkalibacterium ligniniphilum TaxID=1134413 RepID=UPI000349606F|nr:DUF421 domain-containing protein [Halalkalibacterium ligniniphilum]